MRVLFVYSVHDVHSRQRPLRSPDHLQLGVSYISAVLKQHGHETSLIVLGRLLGRRNWRVVDKRLDEFAPQLVCLSAVSSEYAFIEGVARHIRQRLPTAYLLVGGVHVSINPCDEMLRVFDALCIGEGEYPTLELVTQLSKGESPSGILNLWIRHNDTIQKNPARPFLEDLGGLPPPDREVWQDWMVGRSGSRQTVLMGRGCPYSCTFCSNHALREVAPGPYVRVRSPESIAEEVRELKALHPDTKEVYLEVESFVTHVIPPGFATNVGWALSVCEALEKLNKSLDEPLAFGVNLRIAPDVDFDQLFAACKRANVGLVNVGLESGSESLRRKVLKRHYSNDDVRRVVALARQHGIRIVLYNQVGLPGETLADHRETVNMTRECDPDWYYLEIFYPYPGTELYDLCRAKGWIRGDLDSLMERSRAAIDQPGFSRRQIQSSYTWFHYHVYKGKKPFWKILLHVAARKLKSHPSVFFLYRRLTAAGPLRQLRDIAKSA